MQLRSVPSVSVRTDAADPDVAVVVRGSFYDVAREPGDLLGVYSWVDHQASSGPHGATLLRRSDEFRLLAPHVVQFPMPMHRCARTRNDSHIAHSRCVAVKR